MEKVGSSNGGNALKRKQEKGSAPAFRTLKRRVVNPTRFQRQRMESSLSKDHEDHIAGKGYHSIAHYNLVHKSIPMPQAMKIPDAKAAVDKEWKNSRQFQHGTWEKLRAQKKVILEVERDKKKVHFATLMDICHLKKCGVRKKQKQRRSRVPW